MGLTPNVVANTPIVSTWGNTIRDQTVMPFTNAAERAAQWVAPPTGAVSYLRDTNSLEAFNGAAWVNLTGPAMIPHAAARRWVSDSPTQWQNNTTYAPIPTASGATAMRVSFVKRRADTVLLVDLQWTVSVVAGVGQQLFGGVRVTPTAPPGAAVDYDVATRNTYASAPQIPELVGHAQITGLPAGVYQVDPVFRSATAAHQTLMNVTQDQISYQIGESF